MPAQAVQARPTHADITAPAAVRRVVLTGFMGAGKSTVGRLLAKRLGWEFLDLDAAIEARAGVEIAAIFATHGEAHFRQLESEALAEALAHDFSVLALGGGALEARANRALLASDAAAATIFLDAPFSVLYDRCVEQTSEENGGAGPSDLRPNLADRTVAEKRFAERLPVYRELARHIIDTTALTADQAAAEALLLLDRVRSPRGERA